MFRIIVSLAVLTLPYLIEAQPDILPAQHYMERNGIKALVNANGLLFYDYDKGGQFLTDSTNRSPIRAAGLWLGGFDKGDNLKLAAQLYNEDGKQDFIPGMVSMPEGNWNQIWRTTGYDILSHIYDFRYDKVINDTLPSIFGWPAYGNKFFKDYHGFELPDEPNLLADFWDENLNDVYDPENGDFPIIEYRGCDYFFGVNLPDEILWYVFHDNTTHTQSDTSLPILMNISNTVFSYSCTDNPMLNNSIFSKYKLVNAAYEDIDSCFFGTFMDFALGCPEDDYFGTIPESNIVFVYNSDNFDESCGEHKGFGESPPTVAVKLIRGPLDEFRRELFLSSVLPLHEEPPNLGMGMPKDAQDFYNYLTGRWLDGTPLTYGGNGYDQTNTDYFSFIYPDYPTEVGLWNELSEDNAPGRRRAIASTGPFKLQPGATNEMLVSFTFLENGRYPLDLHLLDLYKGLESTISIFDDCFGGPPIHCTSANPLPDLPPNPIRISDDSFIFVPNPASETVKIRIIDFNFATSFEIYDSMCRLMYKTEDTFSYSAIDVSDWPQGIYYAIARKGPEMYFNKLVIAR